MTLLHYQFISKEKTKADIAGRLINNILFWGEILSRISPMSFTFYGICIASMKFGWMHTVCNKNLSNYTSLNIRYLHTKARMMFKTNNNFFHECDIIHHNLCRALWLKSNLTYFMVFLYKKCSNSRWQKV